jgi:hypothetical protein
MASAGSSARGCSSTSFERYPEQENTASDLIQDGRTIATALWSLAFQQNPNQVSYIVKDLTRGYIRVPIANAREMAIDGHRVYDDRGVEIVEWDPPLPVLNHDDAFHDQIEGVYDAEDAITADADGGKLPYLYTRLSDRQYIQEDTPKKTPVKNGSRSPTDKNGSPSGGAAGASPRDAA